MKGRALGLLAAALAASIAAPAGAQGPSPQPAKDSTDLLVHFNGPVSVSQGDTAGSVWVFNNVAQVDGRVRGDLFVVNGTARVNGAVNGNVVVARGHLDLGPNARVGGDVLLFRSTMTRAPGATVAGRIHEERGVSFSARALWFLWISMTLAIIVAGLLLAYLVGPALHDAARTISTDTGGTLIAAVLLLFGLPAAAALSFMTGIGVAVGFFILFVVIPAAAFVGYIVSGIRVGQMLLGRGSQPADRPYLTTAVGIFVLQVIAVIPVIGALVALVASQVGAGALLYRTWRLRRGEGDQTRLAAEAA
jgi:hypothetical protein